MKREDFKINNNSKGYYIHSGMSDKFLFKSRKMLNWGTVYKKYAEWAEKNVYFRTKIEAEQFLTNYLENQMNERLAQVEKDIALLEAEKAKIIKENEVTYSVGQWFKSGDKLYLLAQVGYGECSLIYFINGNEANRSDIIKVEGGCHRITEKDLKNMHSEWESFRPINVEVKEI